MHKVFSSKFGNRVIEIEDDLAGFTKDDLLLKLPLNLVMPLHKANVLSATFKLSYFQDVLLLLLECSKFLHLFIAFCNVFLVDPNPDVDVELLTPSTED